jgi:hypothetical protein
MNPDLGKLTELLNVDLDIRSNTNSDLRNVLLALDRSCFVLNPGSDTHATLELRGGEGASLNEIINFFCIAIENLDVGQREAWNRLQLRSFNIGIQARAKPYQSPFLLTGSTVLRIAGVGADVVLTVYGSFEE